MTVNYSILEQPKTFQRISEDIVKKKKKSHIYELLNKKNKWLPLYKINPAPIKLPRIQLLIFVNSINTFILFLSQNNLKILVLYLAKSEFKNYMISDVYF